MQVSEMDKIMGRSFGVKEWFPASAGATSREPFNATAYQTESSMAATQKSPRPIHIFTWFFFIGDSH